MSDLSVRLCIPDDMYGVGRFLETAPSVSLYHQKDWLEVIERSFGHRCYYFRCKREGDVTGVLPLVHIKSMMFGNMLVSMPFVNYGGLCASDMETGQALVQEAVQLAESVGAQHIELRQEELLKNGMAVLSHKVSMRLALPRDTEELWKSFPSKLRSQIKVPIKAGMTARVGGAEELDAFYHVFSTNMRDLGTPVLSKEFFRNFLEIFPDATRICTVYDKDKPVASGFLAGFRKKLEIPWASSLRDFNRQSPNMLLYNTCLEFGCQNGYEVFDFGRSTPGEGTFRFKQQWGAQPQPLYWHYWKKEGTPLPDISVRNPKYQLAIAVWQMLPVSLTRIIGPMIVRNIP